jgi:hypothetical protein
LVDCKVPARGVLSICVRTTPIEEGIIPLQCRRRAVATILWALPPLLGCSDRTDALAAGPLVEQRTRIGDTTFVRVESGSSWERSPVLRRDLEIGALEGSRRKLSKPLRRRVWLFGGGCGGRGRCLDAVGFLAQKLDHTAVSNLFGISWAAVGSVAERLVAEQLHLVLLPGSRFSLPASFSSTWLWSD